MARPGRRVRVGVLAAVVAWHALVVLLLLQQRVVLTQPPEVVMTWLRFEPPPRPEVRPLPPPIPAPLISPSTALTLPPSAQEQTPAPPQSTAITPPPGVDWYGEASRAAREQFANRLPTPRSLDDRPKAMELPAVKSPEHKLGDLEPTGNGWRLWVSARCYTDIAHEAPLPAGQLRPMSVACLKSPPAIDTAALERRRPDYLAERPITLPRTGRGVGETRPGPAMGGKPVP